MYVVACINNDDGLKLGRTFGCEDYDSAVDKAMELISGYDDTLDAEEIREYVEVDGEYVAEDETWGVYIASLE